jgi:hypothetical protein
VLVIFSARGGHPEDGLVDLEIRHLGSVASCGDIVDGENMAGDGGVLRRYLDEGSVEQLLSTHSCFSGENHKIRSSGSDDGGSAVSCSLLAASFVEQRWREEARDGAVCRLEQSLWRRCRVMPNL